METTLVVSASPVQDHHWVLAPRSDRGHLPDRQGRVPTAGTLLALNRLGVVDWS